MVIAILAIVCLILAGAWTGFDRSTGRAIAGSLGCGAVMAGFAVMLGGDDVFTTALRGAAAMVGAGVGIAVGMLLKGALAGGAERLMVSNSRGSAGAGKASKAGKGRSGPGATEERHKMQAAVAKSRDSAERLVAGNVQLLDLSRLLEPVEGRPRMSKAEALKIAEVTAKAFLKPADLMVKAGDEGLIFLFDGVNLAEAEEKSREIADAITEAFGAGDTDSPFMAKGFAYELDDYMQDAMIDSVDDLIRVVKLAHQAFVMKEKSLAKELDRELQLNARPVVRPDNLSVIGYEVQVMRVRSGADGQKREALTFANLKAPYGSEIDCAAVMKLSSALRNLELGRDHAILMPVRFETLSHPLYLDNLMDVLAALPGNVRTRLVCNLVVDRTSPPPRLDAMAKGLKKFSKGVLIHPKHPFRGLDKAKESGIEGLVISANAFDVEGGQETMEALVNRARKLKLFVTLIGAGVELTLPQKMNLPYSWADK
jgi:hypothetical protein